MSRLVLPLVLATTLTGCARVAVYMKQTNEPGGPDYVIVKIKANKDVVYDCVSEPEGPRDPTCIKAKYRLGAVTADEKAERRADQMGR
jgi:hypothetical protein